MRKIEEFWIEFEPEEKKESASGVSFVFDVVDSLKGAVIAAFVVFCLIFRVIGVEGVSMRPTLQDGDWVAVSGLSMNIEKGDIVIIVDGIDVTVAEVGSAGDDDKDSARLRGHELYGKSFHWGHHSF